MRLSVVVRLFVAFALCAVGNAGCSTGPCSSYDQYFPTVCYGGFVVDVTTNERIQGYTMSIVTATEETAAVEVDDEGKFAFEILTGTDFVLTTEGLGYRAFTTTDQSSTSTAFRRLLYSVPMVPETVVSPAISVSVVDGADGTVIGAGFYRVTLVSLTSVAQSIYEDDVSGSFGGNWWYANSPPIAGAFTEGAFTIPEGALLPGYDYQITIYGVPGYRDLVATTSSVALNTGELNSVAQIDLQLVRTAQPGTPVLIGQSHVAPDGTTAIPISDERKLVLYFDREIEMSAILLRGIGADQLLTVDVTTDDDGDSQTTATLLEVEDLDLNEISSLVRPSAFGSTITLTFGADEDLIDGDVDADDDLSYTMTPALLAGIQLRDAASTGETWIGLDDLVASGFNDQVLIRANFP